MFKRSFLILLGIIVVLSVAFSLSQKSMPSVLRWLASASKPQSAYAFTASEIETKLKKVEEGLPAIEELITRGRYQEGRELFDTTFYELRRSQHDAGNLALDANRTLGGELDRLEARIGRAARREFESWMEKIAGNEPNTAAMHRLVRSFPTLGGSNLEAELAARSGALDKIRRMRATRWIRVQMDATDEDYEDMIADHLVKIMVLPPGFTVVTGPPEGPAEKEATFATVTVKIAAAVESYVEVRKGEKPDWSNDFFHNRGNLGLLARVSVGITLHPAFKDYPTSWDEIPGKSGETIGIYLDIPTPDKFDLPPGRDAREEFKERNAVRLVHMKQKLAKALAAIPPLDFAPGRDVPAAPLSRQNALLNEAGFVSAASASLVAKKSMGPIACVAGELMIESLAERIEAQLPLFSSNERFAFMQVLAARPWYHGYSTLNKMILSAPAENVPFILEGMKRDLDQAPLRKTALTRILHEAPSYQQNQMMETFISFVPPETLVDLAKLYPTFPAGLQSAVLTSLMQRDRPMAAQLAQQLIKSGKSEVAQAVSLAVANGLGTINSGRRMTLLPEETEVFVEALATARGSHREEIIGKLPRSEELLGQFWRSDRSAWTDAENLELYSGFSSLHFDLAREAAITSEVLKALQQGRLKTRKLVQKAGFVLSPIMNQMLISRGDEQIKVPLILQIIDERKGSNAEIYEIYESCVANMVTSIRLPGLLASADARALLAKGKNYPNDHVRQHVRELAAEAAKTDPSFANIL